MGAPARPGQSSAASKDISAQKAFAGSENELASPGLHRPLDVDQMLVDLFFLDPQFLRKPAGVHLSIAQKR